MQTRHWIAIVSLASFCACSGQSAKQAASNEHGSTAAPAKQNPESSPPAATPTPAAASNTTAAPVPSTQTNPPNSSIPSKVTTTASGLQYADIVVGSGPMPKQGQTCVMHYTGWLTTGSKFDSSRDRGKPYPFVLGSHSVIKGWEEGISTMRVGGRRKLVVPPQLGYANRAFGDIIPANSTLIFDLELVEVR